MQKVGKNFLYQLRRKSRRFIDVVEFYDEKEINITDKNAPARAKGLFSQYCVSWNGFKYEPYLLGGIGEISYTKTRESNSGSLQFSNIDRQMTAWALNNTVQGMRVVVRRVYPSDNNNYQIIAANLRARRPRGFNYKEFSVALAEDDGGLNRQIPRRNLGKLCPLDFGGMMCLNCKPLSQKSLAFQSAWNNYGEDGCDKRFETCVNLQNPEAFQGIRFQAVSGNFQVAVTEVKRFLFFFKRKKTTYKTVAYSSNNIDSEDKTIGMVFGRSQVLAKPMQWVDTGTIIKHTQYLTEGPIDSIFELKNRSVGFSASGYPTIHKGECGGIGSQVPDARFPNSGFFSRLAYFGDDSAGSTIDQVDEAPNYSAIIRGWLFDLPNANGIFNQKKWTDVGPFITRGLYLDPEFGDKKADYWADSATIKAANICNQIIEDRTNSERAVLPQSEQPLYNSQFRRFRSTGIISGYHYRNEFGQLPPFSDPPDMLDAYIDWHDPLFPPSAVNPIIYLRRRYTTNIYLREQVGLKDFIHKTVLPSFQGYLAVNEKGETEVNVETAVDHAYTRQNTAFGTNLLPVDDLRNWIQDKRGFIIVGNGTPNAEPHKVINYRYSTACNGTVITQIETGTVTLSGSATFSGGNISTPSTANLTLSGTVSVNSQVGVIIDGISAYYTCEAGDTLESAAAMLAGQINAQPTLGRYIIAEAVGNSITFLCTQGFLELDSNLLHDHVQGEENIRVEYVFEDCGDLKLDNIKQGSFRWNEDEYNETTRIKATYINAVDDFATTEILRKARHAEKLLGTQNTYDFDGTGVDNTNQILRLTKSKLIEFRDCDFWASWESYGEATLLQVGDVVAVRHTSGDSTAGFAVNYMPLRIQKLAHTATQTIKLNGQLYLTAQYNDEVRQSEPTVQNTLTSDPNAGTNNPPPPSGTVGGTSGSTYTPHPCNPYSYYGYGFTRNAGFSPCGQDVGGM